MSLNSGGLVEGNTRRVDPQQFTQMKDNLINDINSILKQKVKDNRSGGLPGTSVNDLRDLKQSFEFLCALLHIVIRRHKFIGSKLFN